MDDDFYGATKPNDRQVGGDHYKGAKFQHWDFVMATNQNYLQGQASRYVSRAYRHEDGPKMNLEKALHYLDKIEELDPAIVMFEGQKEHLHRFVTENDQTLEQASTLGHIINGDWNYAKLFINRMIRSI